MSDRIECALSRWLAEGRGVIGEIRIEMADGTWRMRHRLDAPDVAVEKWRSPEDAIEIAKWDANGNFRPLKTAPNLRRGWSLEVSSLRALRQALDYFYPAMLGSFLAVQENRLEAVPLRDSLRRQSGMYAVTRKITDDDADTVIARTCSSSHGCLKTILWQIDGGRPVRSLPPSKFSLATDQAGGQGGHIPLPCAEACNLLIAAMRSAVKKKS